MGKKMLVTGATGFIGKRLCSFLKKNNHSVRIISRDKDSRSDDTVICDLKDGVLKSDLFDGVQNVYHLAGYAHDLGNPKKLEDEYYSTNVLATINLAEKAAKNKVEKFIFISSVKAGSSNKNKHLILFSTDSGILRVNATVWMVGKKYILLKENLYIPIKSIIEIQ